MISLFLLTFVCASNAISLKNLFGVGSLLHQTENNTIENNTLKSQTMFEKIVEDPKAFVSEIQELDPAAVQNVILLLNELLATSEARESHLVDSLADANLALNTANTNVLNALDDLTAAQTRTAAARTAVSNANQEQADAEAAEAAIQTDLEQKRQVHSEKQTEQGAAQTAHDGEVASLNHEQQVLRDVIAMLEGLPVQQNAWQEIADVPANGGDNADAAFWNSLCGSYPDLTPEDIIMVHMGLVKDFFRPATDMSMCHFLLHQEYTWSATEDGNYVTPNMHGSAFGGSAGGWPSSIDGRIYISFWGPHGGCCHDSSTIYGGTADGGAWHRAFTMHVKYH